MVSQSVKENRQDKLDACVKRISKIEGVPPFCEHASGLIERTLDLECTSAHLTQEILKDLGLASQILRLANSAAYNRSGRPILSVSHAVTLLGWETVRNQVSAVRYIEHYAKRSPAVREAMLLAVLSAMHCREVAAVIQYPNPDEAYLCGLFRNLGEVLIACHYPHQHSQIIVAMHDEKISEAAAAMRVLDFKWNEAGATLADNWNMPAKIRLSMEGAAQPAGAPLDRCLASITEYGHQLTAALYREGADLNSIQARPIIDPQGRQSKVALRDLRKIVDLAAKETEQIFATLRIPVDRLRLEQQAHQARQVLESLPVFSDDQLEALDERVAEAEETLRGNEFELSALIAGLLDAIHGAGFERVIFCLVNPDHTFIRGRLAGGSSVDQDVDRFQFPMDGADGPMRAALQRRVDLFVDRCRDLRYETSSLVRAFKPSAFALLPVVVAGHASACLYADLRGSVRGFEDARPALCRVRDAIAVALCKKAPQAQAS